MMFKIAFRFYYKAVQRVVAAAVRTMNIYIIHCGICGNIVCNDWKYCKLYYRGLDVYHVGVYNRNLIYIRHRKEWRFVIIDVLFFSVSFLFPISGENVHKPPFKEVNLYFPVNVVKVTNNSVHRNSVYLNRIQ